MDEIARLITLKGQGYTCSQILVEMGLELQGKTNTDVLRTVRGLSGGIGFSGGICGALTGGACMLGLYAGKGTPQEEQDERLNVMVQELLAWFKETWVPRYGGVECERLLSGDMNNAAQRCPEIVYGVYQKAKELLVENGFDLSGTNADE